MDKNAYFPIDNYNHRDETCFYIDSCIPGPGAPPELEEEFEIGCSCPDSCFASTCSCQPYGKNYSLTNGRQILESNVLKRNLPVTECHSRCQCFENINKSVNLKFHTNRDALSGFCINRCVQFGPSNELEIFSTCKKGYGLRAKRNLLKYEFICEYAGEIINENEACKRIEENRKKKLMNYVFVLYEFVSSFDGPRQVATCVDPGRFGNLGRYINHSCSANAVVVPVRVSTPVPHLCIFALQDIHIGEEITFDYSGDFNRKPDKYSHTQCFCGSDYCRKWLPA